MIQKSIELIHLEYLNRRHIALEATKQRKLGKLLRGYKGEAELILWFKKYGSRHVRLVPNYWFHEGKTMESDVLVLTDELWCTVDVKNFDGFFEYKNEACYINGHLLDENFFHTMSTRIRKLQRIAGEVSKKIKVVGAMVFINEHNQISIDREVDFDVVTRNQLKNYIAGIKQYQPMSDYLVNQIDKALARYKTANPFRPTGLKPEEFDKLRKGVCCSRCGSYDVNISRKFITCHQCQNTFLKSDAICEAARELKYIFIDNPEFVTTGNVRKLLNNTVSERTVVRTLAGKYQRNMKSISPYYYIPIP